MYYINIENLINFTPVPNYFIDKYAGCIDSTYIVVYLYIARHAIKGKLPTEEELSEQFSLSKEVIHKIITYWDREGLFDKPEKPCYSPSVISKMMNSDSEISGLISTASAILGRALGQKEQSTILSLYDYYKLPVDVITILLGHCAEVGNSSINYIEKIAIDWSEKNIKTAEEAEDYLKLYYGDFTKIMRAFGINGRLATAKEKKYMEKWLVRDKQPMELVLEACEETVVNTGKISWKYADTILKDWLENNIKTVEQARKYTDEHAVKSKAEKAGKKPKTAEPAPKPVRKTNSFNNFDGRDYSQNELLDLALELLEEHNDDA
ncbi:MAG: DnaD domain protein [Clostridiales bacterium]|nr:DnaD domain protein [Clostridiales bacterium]